MKAIGARRLAILVVVGLVSTTAAIAGGCGDDASDAASPGDAGTDALAVPDAPASDGGDASAMRGHGRLSETGFFSDVANKVVAPDLVAFEPAFTLWSDGATKKRWVRLPPGTTIDTTDPDHWQLPIGAQLFKEFSVDGKRIETRLVERTGAGERDDSYFLGAFLWRDDESDADFVPDGKLDARGTAHDVPAAKACWACHIGEPGHALGFSALQLSHAGPGLTLAALRAEGRVPTTLADAPLPIAPVGYLHANCGHCHNINGASWPDTDMTLRWTYGDSSLVDSAMYKSTVGVKTRSFQNADHPLRIAPGDPSTSAVAYRMGTRIDGGAMPPIATEIVDDAGAGAVAAWIATLDAGAQ